MEEIRINSIKLKKALKYELLKSIYKFKCERIYLYLRNKNFCRSYFENTNLFLDWEDLKIILTKNLILSSSSNQIFNIYVQTIKKLSNITFLSLNLSSFIKSETREIQDNIFKLLSNFLSELSQITIINLNLGYNQIRAYGAIDLSKSLSNLSNLTSLNLNLNVD